MLRFYLNIFGVLIGLYKFAYDKLEKEISGEIALNFVSEISSHHRIQASPGIRDAVNYAVKTMKGYGLDAKVHDWPADGKTFSWTSLHIEEWGCKDAGLKLINPTSEYKHLCRFSEDKISVIQRSYPTPKGGIEGEVVILDKGEQEADYKKVDVSGKWVMTNGNITKVYEEAIVKRGAIGIVYDGMFLRPPTLLEGDLDDARKYTSFWWNGKDKPGLGFVLTPRQGRWLRELVPKQDKLNDPVKLSGYVDSTLGKGTIEDAVITIPGKTYELVMVAAHICHPQPSANDNASGSGSAMEAARALHTLIKSGVLPKPRRTIVFTLVPEMLGTYTYLAANEDKIPKMVAALNLDMVGENQDLCKSTLTVEKTPEANASYVNALMEAIFTEIKQEIGNLGGSEKYPLFRHFVGPYSGGSDHYIYSDPNIGVPCPMLIQWPDKFYHTSADTIDKVDPDSLRRVALMTATYVYSIANASPEDSIWLVNEVASVERRNLVNYVRNLTSGALQNTDDNEVKLGAARDRLNQAIPYKVDRAKAAITSVKRLANGYKPYAEKVERLSNDLEKLGKSELKEAVRTIEEYAISQKLELPRKKSKRATKLSKEADGLVPVRVYRGPISSRPWVAKLSKKDKEAYAAFNKKYPLGRRYGGTAMFWTNGIRSIKEISDLVELEKGSTDLEFLVGYYNYYKKMGLIKYA